MDRPYSHLDVEFSLALNNRTGKFFALRDVIEGQAGRIRRVRYWRFTFGAVPGGLTARVIGRLMTLEVLARVRSPFVARWLPAMRPGVPVFFTDPLQTLLYKLEPQDVVVVHDMGPVLTPRFYAPGVEALYLKAFGDIARVKPRLVFVSQASRDAFTALYGAAYRHAEVIYNPIRVEAMEGLEQAPADIRRPFLLCVGAVGSRKNQAGALRGFRLAELHQRGFDFVICGGPEPGHQEVVDEVQRTPGARMIGYANEAELRWLYRHAAGFVLTSWLEGFGVPAAEAIERHLLPLLSKEPALMEVAGPSAIYVDADDDASIADGIIELVEMDDDERRARLLAAKQGLRRFDSGAVRAAWTAYFDGLIVGSPNPQRF